MWAQYRRTFLVTQIFIVGLCAVLLLTRRANWVNVAVAFVVMELAAVPGAWWSARLRAKTLASQDRLPLDRR